MHPGVGGLQTKFAMDMTQRGFLLESYRILQIQNCITLHSILLQEMRFGLSRISLCHLSPYLNLNPANNNSLQCVHQHGDNLKHLDGSVIALFVPNLSYFCTRDSNRLQA